MKHILSVFLILHCCLFSPAAFAQQPVEAWARSYNGPTNTIDNAGAIAIDAAGNSYVAGSSSIMGTDFMISFSQIVVIKYSPAGDRLWVATIEPGSLSSDVGIATDNMGGVYVAGTTTRPGSGQDYVTIRLDAATGNESWVQYYNGPANGRDRAMAIAVDEQGGVYVTGGSTDYITANQVEYNDYATIRYEAATGTQTWVQRYNGPANQHDVATAIAVDNQGSVFVSGSSNTPDGNSNILTIR